MADREKVIKGLECCQRFLKSHCDECPYIYEYLCGINDCTADLASDAIALLKEQEPKTILGIADSIEGIEVGKCPRCERTILSKQSDPTRFCKYCGQEVKWA